MLGVLVGIAVVGAGYMGAAHARVVKRISEEYPGLAELRYIVDVDASRARYVSRRYGGTPLESIESLPEGGADLAIVATPTRTHVEVVEKLVERGIGGFLVEKPLAGDLASSLRLVELAESQGLWISVGHIERFNPAIGKLLEKTRSGSLGRVLTTVSRRVGPFAARVSDTSVVHDLAVHEIDVSLLLYGVFPATIRSYTLENIVSNLADYALIVMGYEYGFSSIEVNRVTPFKQRILYVTGSRGVGFVDYMRQETRLYVGDEEVKVIVENEEPLYREDLAVIMSLSKNERPPVSVYQAFAAILLCDKALESTKESREIALDEDEDYNRYRDIIGRGVGELANWRPLPEQ